jgi:hypothetical protein
MQYVKIKRYAAANEVFFVQILSRPATWWGWLRGYELHLATTDVQEGEAFYNQIIKAK